MESNAAVSQWSQYRYLCNVKSAEKSETFSIAENFLTVWLNGASQEQVG